MVSIINKDSTVQSQISKALIDFKQIGEKGGTQAQADLCPQLIANNITKDTMLLVMRDTLIEQEYELDSYQKTLGRKLSDKEVTDFIQQHSTPALFEKSDMKILQRLSRNLERSKQLTKLWIDVSTSRQETLGKVFEY